MPNGNLLTTLQLIRKSEQITRQDLATQLGLSFSMVSKLASDLLERHLVHEIGRMETGSRRSSGLLAINPHAGYAIGLDINGTHQKAVLVNLLGKVVAHQVENRHIPANHQEFLDGLDQTTQQMIASNALTASQIMGVGIGLWATVNPQTGVVSSWTETPDLADTWRDFAFRDALINRWSFPYIIVDDIVRSLGIAEARYGHNHGEDRGFLYVLVDSGIGMAIMFNDTPFIGAIQIAGEIGHIPLGNVSIHCSCGNVGCLETVASATAILERVRQRLNDTNIRSTLREREISIQKIIEAAEGGDKLAYQVLLEAGQYLGVALAISVNLLGPELIVVGGTLAGSAIYMEAARQSFRLQALSKAAPLVRIESSLQDHLAGARGAATQVLNEMFSDSSANILDLKSVK